MTDQQIDRDQLRAVAHHAEQANSAVYLAPRSLLALLDQLEQAERDRDWLFRSSRLSKKERIKANARADQSEARIESLEDTARVLVREVIAAEDARDVHRRGRASAEARIKAVEDVLDQYEQENADTPDRYPTPHGDGLGPTLVAAADIRRALEG